MDLKKEHLEFFEEAKEAFNDRPRLETYRNEDETFIALRYGMDRDSMLVFSLDTKVAFLHNVLDKQ